MAVLKDWLSKLAYEVLSGTDEAEVTEVIYDSRKAAPDTVFVCITGTKSDSHDFIEEAAEKGCRCFVVEKKLDELKLPAALLEGDSALNLIRVKNSRSALAYLSGARFGNPSEKLVMIGITGTKGKTTTTCMISEILKHCGEKVGIIGTNGCEIAGEHFLTRNTTPESYELHRYFAQMVEAGCKYTIMECSSQGFKLHRTDGIIFDYGLYLNLSPDHIGPLEHADFAEYLSCKAKLLTQSRTAILNGEDAHAGEVLEAAKRYWMPDCPFVSADGIPAQNPLEHTYTCGLSETDDLRASDLHYVAGAEFVGVTFRTSGIYEDEVQLSVPGAFNVLNALAAIAVSAFLQLPREKVNEALANIHVDGRMETVFRSPRFQVIVDYAHNEVSMESLLATLRSYRPGRLVVVFGCGGNRSKERRTGMGSVAARSADLSIFTSDNSRYEKPEDIIADIKEAYLTAGGSVENCREIPDRRAAIRYALEHAKQNDLIAVIGKGHEDYQEENGVRKHFLDREVILEEAKALGLLEEPECGAQTTEA